MRLALSLAFLLSPLSLVAQNDLLDFSDELILDEDFGFEEPFEDHFESAFEDQTQVDDFGVSFFDGEEPRARKLPAWLSGFTTKITQQVLLQTRTHEASLLAPGDQLFTLPKQADVETNRLAANIRYQYAFAPGWLLQASGFARLFLYDDYEYEANGQDFGTEFRLNEFFVQRSFGEHSVKVGNQTVVWGEVDGNSVLDVINRIDFRDFSAIDIEDIRMNQPMLVWEYFGDRLGERSRLSTFVTLYPEYNPPLMRGSPFYAEPIFPIDDYKRQGDPDFEAGIRWSRSFEGSDIAFMAAYLIENQLRHLPPPTLQGDALAVNNAFSLFGFSANRALGKLLLNLDVAYTQGVVVNNINLPSGVGAGNTQATRDQLGTSLGMEYAINNEQNIAVSVQILEPLKSGESQGEEERTGIWLMRYSNALMNGDLALAVTMQGDLEAQFSILQASASRTLNDRWAAAINLTVLDGVETSPISLFAGDIRVGFNLTYSF